MNGKDFESSIVSYLLDVNAQLTLSLLLKDGQQRPPLNFSQIPGDGPTIANPREFFRLDDTLDKSAVDITTKNKSTYAERMANKLQSDIRSIFQRDFIMEKTPRIRAIALEASKRHRHGESDGPVNNMVMGQVRALLRQSSGNQNGIA